MKDTKLRNLARLRKAYQEMNPYDINTRRAILENAMLEIEEILEEHGIDYNEFDSSGLLEE